jgi:fucose permease
MALLSVPIIAATVLLSPSMLSDGQPRRRGTKPTPRARRLSRALIVLGAVSFAAMVCEGASADWSAVYLHGSANIAHGLAGLGYAAFAVTMASVRLSGTRLLERVPARRLLPALAVLASAGMALALATGTAIMGIVGFATLGAGMALVVPTLFTAASRLPGLATGVGITLVSAFGWAGFVLGPPLIGGLSGLAGLRTALVILPALALVIGLATARVGTPATTSSVEH